MPTQNEEEEIIDLMPNQIEQLTFEEITTLKQTLRTIGGWYVSSQGLKYYSGDAYISIQTSPTLEMVVNDGMKNVVEIGKYNNNWGIKASSGEIGGWYVSSQGLKYYSGDAYLKMMTSPILKLEMNDGTRNVFQVIGSGTDKGDVVIGDYANKKGLKWDDSAGTFNVRGALNADDITAGTLTGRTIRTAANGERIQLDSSNYLRGYDSSNKLRMVLRPNELFFYDSNEVRTFYLYTTTNGFLIDRILNKSVIAATSSGTNFYSPNGYNYLIIYDDYFAFLKDIIPISVGEKNIGSAGLYWNEVNAKSFIDRGCIIDIEENEALQGLRDIKKPKKFLKSRQSEKLKTNPKYSRLDYDSFPDYIKEIPSKKEQKEGAEKGVDLSSAISMLIGVCKNLDNRLQKLEYEKSK